MAYKEELIQFNIVNNTTDCVINVPLFSQSAPSINATTKYQWQIITADLSCGCWSIIINSQPYYINFDGTLIGLQNAFNNLGFGFACTTTIGADTFLYTFDDTNVYGAIETCYCLTTSTTTTTTTLPITTTTTTTTTTLPITTTTTTSTTTLPLLANVNINNGFFAGTIDDVKVNGVSISGATFPLPIGNGTNGTTNQIGTYTIEVNFSGVTLTSHINCTDSTSTTSCTNMSGSGAVLFNSQVINGVVDINIDSFDANC